MDNEKMKDVIENMNAYMTRPYKYSGYLPKDLDKYHTYFIDAGHSIICVLEADLEEAQKTGMYQYEVPVPVKYVTEKGYRIVDDHVIVDAPYDEFLGLVVDDKYTEYQEM